MKKIYRIICWIFRKNQCCCEKRIQGKNLIFISHIKRDGSGTTPVEQSPKHLQEHSFKLTCLSITNGTYIASDFNLFVVKLK